MRRAAKKDIAQHPIVEELRGYGAMVYILNQRSLPDLLVGFKGETILLEVKDPKTWRGRQLTPPQEEFYRTWNGGRVRVVHSMLEAKGVLGL